MQAQYDDIVIWRLRVFSGNGAGHTIAIPSFGSGDNLLSISICVYNNQQPHETIALTKYLLFCYLAQKA